MVVRSLKNQYYQIWTYCISPVRKFNAGQFLQKKCNLEVHIFQFILKYTCWTCYINNYAYLFEVQECKYCVWKSVNYSYIWKEYGTDIAQSCVVSQYLYWNTEKYFSKGAKGLTFNLTYFWVAEFINGVRFALSHQVLEICVIPIFIGFYIFFAKSETVLLFWLKKKYVRLKNKLKNDFKYRLDVKDSLKTSLHWKIMSLSKISFQKVLHS